ncbi:DUF3857 domain-containing protein [Mucilaginibacter daejeonensis]|uniref:DUF3857 domain-containing protein n=1 Tax=Mucilaginibacter daejeonensis TaxID=398049 RepID=UPI001D17580F|nr:DUF3857 domain-containing protein [Mucilaginibacter daejeonensis]UEG53017.1 DUF3857 domain-containing protein [Mucilaginibacter daejeonensis]
MKRTLMPLAVLLLSTALSFGQQKIESHTPAFGKIDKADLEMKTCDFEKDANAMVLFSKGDVYYDESFNIVVEYHKRIKILTDAGKKQGDIRIEYYGGNRYEYITNLQAEIFNLNNDKVEVTKLDKKQVYTENVDKNLMAMIFSFPNVKAGSVIEYKYRRTVNSLSSIPDWAFQETIPVKHSELITTIPEWFIFRTQQRNYAPFTQHLTSKVTRSITTGSATNAVMLNEDKELYVMDDVPSMIKEPYMSSEVDNTRTIYFQLVHFQPPAGFTQSFSDTWAKVGSILADHEDFGSQLRRKLAGEEELITKAKALKTDGQKIAYLFGEVKNAMKWNGIDRWYTNDGTVKAWEKKTGNSTEVNLILYHLLKQSGVRSYPMLVSTRSHGKVNPAFSFLYQFNRAVVYVPVDSTKYYVLDATNKYNSHLDIPDEVLNSHALWVDKDNKRYDLKFVDNEVPERYVAYINAEISADSRMSGTAQISNFNYGRLAGLTNFKTNGEKKYTDQLRGNNNSLTITSLKMDNIDVDSLPLNHNINFKLELTGSDNNYIYFNPIPFSGMSSNPFITENRVSNIDLGHCNTYSLTTVIKLPAGYHTDALPKSLSLMMPDKSISCNRTVAQEDGTLLIRYQINNKKNFYPKEDYPYLREFYKKMHEMLNEQVVLKKG